MTLDANKALIRHVFEKVIPAGDSAAMREHPARETKQARFAGQLQVMTGEQGLAMMAAIQPRFANDGSAAAKVRPGHRASASLGERSALNRGLLSCSSGEWVKMCSGRA